MTRHKDADWKLPDTIDTQIAQLAVLMDLRDELKKLNTLLHCHNFINIPQLLRQIRTNTTKRKRKTQRR